MKKYLSLKYLTSVLFLAFMGYMLVSSIQPCYYMAYHQLECYRSGEGISPSKIEHEYNDALPSKDLYITLNGGFQRLMGIRHINDRYRLDNGQLTYVIPETDVTLHANNTIALRDALEKSGIPFGYINTLFKVDPEDKQLPTGVEDYSNENVDQFLQMLEEEEVPVLDLRRLVKEQELDHYSLFYATDHHWKAEAGFWAATQVTNWLASFDSSFAVDPALAAAENYEHTIYEDIFCGSAARRVGPLYAGLDDLTVIRPRFATSLQVDVPAINLYREGSFEDTLLFYSYLTRENMLENSAYSVYMGADQEQLRVTNLSRSQGLDMQSTPKKLLILKDSSALVVAPWLALSYDEVTLLDLRQFSQNLLDYITEYQPDMVLVMYNPGALELHNLNMYQFIR